MYCNKHENQQQIGTDQIAGYKAKTCHELTCQIDLTCLQSLVPVQS